MPGDRRRARRHVFSIAIIVVCVGFIAYAVVLATRPTVPAAPATPVASATLHAGSVAPHDFVLPRLIGTGKISLASLIDNRPAVVNFFASWCPDCAAELGSFATVSHADVGKVAFVGIDTADHDPGAARSLLQKAGDAYPVLVDDSNLTVADAYGIGNGIPVTFFVARNGRVQADFLGKLSTSELQRMTDQLLAG